MGKIPVIFEIRVPLQLTNDIGRDLRSISRFPDEKEWLLSYGTELEIGTISSYTFEYYGEEYHGCKIILKQSPMKTDLF